MERNNLDVYVYLYILSLLFFKYIESVPSWMDTCNIDVVPSDIVSLEAAIHDHMNFYESICEKYSEVKYFCIYLIFEVINISSLIVITLMYCIYFNLIITIKFCSMFYKNFLSLQFCFCFFCFEACFLSLL